MSLPPQAVEAEAVAEIAYQMKNQGYDVQIRPPAAAHPFDLEGYLPDIIARRDNEGLIVEVKASESRTSVDTYVQVAEIVSRHPGWRFLLVPAERLQEQSFADLVSLPSSDQLQKRAAVARDLLRSHNHAAAFLTAWSGIEGALRKSAADHAVPATALSTTALFKQLYSVGLISRQQLQQLEELQQVRNAVVHGFSDEGAAAGSVRLVSLLEEMLEDSGV